MSACSVRCDHDVTESLVEPLLLWSRYTVIPLAGLSRRSAGHWRPWACHATNHKKIYLLTDFHNFCCKKNQAIIIIKKINIMFNKTILILTFFLRNFFLKW